ncbi:MAG TPA: hypothetical protein VEQ60_31435, partial [Longimicrobium sp.]|nr:hypothetical protein [Longimicrobium sp.]
MKHDSRRALEQDVKGEFHLPLLKLHGASGWDVYLGTALAGGALALLVLHPAEGGKRELDVVRSLRADNGVGVTRCPRCAAVAPGWPRFCAGCAHDLRNVPGSADTVREVLEQQWPGSRLLGSIPDSEGGGAMYLVRGGRRGLRTGFVTGMVIDRDEAGAPVVVPCWAMDQATLERCRQTPARAAVRPVGVGSANRPPENTPPAGPREVEAKERRPLGRRELRWAAAALLLLLSGVLAFNPSLRGRDTQPTVPP